jgi:hypothetical protein
MKLRFRIRHLGSEVQALKLYLSCHVSVERIHTELGVVVVHTRYSSTWQGRGRRIEC